MAGAPISGFTRGDLKPTGISGHAPRSYTDLGRPFRERAGERRFGVAPKDRPKPRRFGVIHAGIRRSGVSRRFGVIHQNLRRSGKNPYIICVFISVFTHTTTCSHSAPCLQLAPPVPTTTPPRSCRKRGKTFGIKSLDLNIIP